MHWVQFSQITSRHRTQALATLQPAVKELASCAECAEQSCVFEGQLTHSHVQIITVAVLRILFVCCSAAGAPSASSPTAAAFATALASAAQSNVNAAAQVIAQASARAYLLALLPLQLLIRLLSKQALRQPLSSARHMQRDVRSPICFHIVEMLVAFNCSLSADAPCLRQKE